MYVVIAGGGRTGTHLASVLLEEKHKVRVIENRKELLTRMHRELPTDTICEGSPIDPVVLEQAGIGQAQVLAATTDTDANNLVLCYIGRKMFDVPRIIARVNNPRHAWLFTDKFNVDVALNQADVLAHLIQEEMSMGDMMTLVKLRRGRYSLVEEKIPKGAKAIGCAIKDIGFPEQCVIAAIIRNGKVTIPHGEIIFETDDEVLAVTDQEGSRFLSDLFTPSIR